MPTERCESGRIGQSRKLLSWQRDRGFDPHPLRQTKLARADGVPGASVLFIWSVWSVWSVWSIRSVPSVSCVWLNETNQMNQTDQTDQIDQTDQTDQTNQTNQTDQIDQINPSRLSFAPVPSTLA